MRFSEFDYFWLPTTLSSICSFRKKRKSSIKKFYVSTENILQNYKGIEQYNSNEVISGVEFLTGDILMANIRPYLKKVYMAEFDGVSNSDVLIFKSDMVDSNFLHCILANDNFINYVMNSVKGSKMPRGDKIHIMNYHLSIPKAKEQEKIAKFIDLINQRIDTQSKIIEDLELFEKEINNTIINKLVEHKDLVKFSSLYNFAKEGGTPNTSHPEYYTKGSIPFVKIDDLTTKYLVSNQSFITKLGLENSSAWLIPANSILYSNGATIGAISINKYPVTTKQGILGIVPKSDYLSDYLYYFLRSNYFKKEICRITTQGTMKSAYIKDIDNILVPHVNKNQQNEILTLLSEITLKIEKEKDILKLYKKQKAYLLKNMFI